MATARAYLVSKGLAQGTRGRFSGDAKAELARARAEGMTFDDDPVAKPVRTIVTDETPTEAKPEKPKRHDHGANPAHISPITTQETFEFEKPVGVVSSSTACANCGYSLSYVNCGNTQVRDWRTGTLCSLV